MLTLALLFQFQVPADAYADSATRELVNEVRAARLRSERLVTGYSVRASQRLGVALRAPGRDRMIWRQELVADIQWRRDSPSTVTMVGARESAPIADRKDRIPPGLIGDVRELVFDPGSDYLHVIGVDGEGLVYPLREGGELDYRFAIAGTTEIRLGDGRVIRIVALEVRPRRDDWRLISGTLWFDADTRGLVRAAFRPARPFRLQRDSGDEDIPGWIDFSAEARYITLEYGLYDGRWWLPRHVAIDAVARAGSWLNTPFRLERIYQDYEVEGGTPPDPSSTFVPAGRSRWLHPDGTPFDSLTRKQAIDSLQVAVSECVDEVKAKIDSASDGGRAMRARVAECRERSWPENLALVMPTDTASLLTSSALGEPILDIGDLITESELASLSSTIGTIPDRPWMRSVELPNGVGSVLRHARYNKIEGLSLGAAGRADFGKFRIDAIGRIGIADGEPNAEVSLVRETSGTRWSVSAYRQLAAANPELRPFGSVNSSMALFAGRDDGQYYRTRGVAVKIADNDGFGWELGAWHQRETAAEVETDWSLPHLFDNDHRFFGNITADAATQTGASLTVRHRKPLSADVSLGAQATLTAATGDYEFSTGSARLNFVITPDAKLGGGITVAAGTSRGNVPVQSGFFLGGVNSVRGYPGGFVSGDSHWLMRAEISRGTVAARLVGFFDAGWAGSRQDFGLSDAWTGAGVGLSLLDGLIRFDVAHGFRDPGGTRFELYLDGML
jgi:hypothetical protein